MADLSPSDAAGQPRLGDSVSSGLLWLSAQTLSTKVVNFLGQIVLAKLLLPEDFGAIGLAYTVTAFTTLLQQAGVREVLLSRRKRFRGWAPPAAWMALAAGTVAGLALFALAPLAARIYGVPVLVGLIWVLAVNSPIESLQVVPDARLRSRMQFRPLALINGSKAVGAMGLAIVFASLGWGPYSFVLPLPITTTAAVVALWILAGPMASWKPRFRRWRYLVSDSGFVVAATLLYLTVTQGDYFILGLLQTTQVVGLYFFAYQISMQTVAALTFQLTGILLPALARLKGDPRRQLAGFLHAQRLLALVVIPICLLQIPLAGPLIRLVFAPRWYPAILLIQILSVGMMFRTLSMTHAALIQAQGRFRTRFLLALCSAVGFFLIAVPAARFRGAVGMASAVSVYAAIVGPINLLVTIRPAGGRAADLLRMVRAPLAAAVAAVSISALAASWVPNMNGADAVRVVVVLLVSGAIYTPLVLRMAPDDCRELLARLRGLARKAGVGGG